MKQIKFLILGLIVLPILLQSCASGLTANVRKAETSIQSGKLAEAKQLIDAAVEDSIAQQEAKTWMAYGNTYLAIATDSTSSVEAENPLQNAYTGYSKVVEMEDTTSLLGVQADQQIEQVWANAINNGATLYSNQSYEEAIKLFDVAKMAMPSDTTAYIYGG
ncbi:MAG: hypothetical protein AAF223_08200, partial [Bacteroidota bacterium]